MQFLYLILCCASSSHWPSPSSPPSKMTLTWTALGIQKSETKAQAPIKVDAEQQRHESQRV